MIEDYIATHNDIITRFEAYDSVDFYYLFEHNEFIGITPYHYIHIKSFDDYVAFLLLIHVRGYSEFAIYFINELPQDFLNTVYDQRSELTSIDIMEEEDDDIEEYLLGHGDAEMVEKYMNLKFAIDHQSLYMEEYDDDFYIYYYDIGCNCIRILGLKCADTMNSPTSILCTNTHNDKILNFWLPKLGVL